MSEQLTRVHYRSKGHAMLCRLGGTPRRATTNGTQVTCLQCLRRLQTFLTQIPDEPGDDQPHRRSARDGPPADPGS